MPVSAYNPNTSTRVATRNADGDVVRYTYDVFGNKTTMTTYRNESLGPSSGDVTTWRYDEASNCMTNKVYADGKGPKYDYTPDGRLSQRIWARGIVTDYAYDGWGSLTNTVYSDGTPTVTLFYDAMGRQTNAVDAAGVTTFGYDDFGAVVNETVIGPAGENTIVRYWDAYGRTAGYTLNNVRQTTIGYDAATGRIATMLANGSDVPFAWSYLPGSDLKSSLAYPNGLTASWTYDADGQLLQVRNAVVATAPSPSETEVISQYDYAYDNAGRRISCAKSGSSFTQNDALSYGYNEKSELTNAVAAVDSDYHYLYDFDDIGNRESAAERGVNVAYSANNLNQYTAVDDFVPQFDEDGNQTLVKTATDIWSVVYNGENRPVLWTLEVSATPNPSGPSSISMSYDRMGRRVMKNDQRFAYDGYLQVGNIEHQVSGIKHQTFIWDPTESVATRPLVWDTVNAAKYYIHDGSKNVSEVIAIDGSIAAHYEYAPFGAVAVQRGEFALDNPWRFSSEYAENDTATVYYNYRHYEPVMGRWLSRDPLENGGMINIYSFLDNVFGRYSDWLGQIPILPIFQAAFKSALKNAAKSFVTDFLTSFYDITLDNGKLVGDAIWSCGSSNFEFHDIKLNRPGDSSAFIIAFQKGAWNGITSLATETLTGSLSEIIRKNASKFLMAKRGNPYYKYYKKIEKLITKEGAQELTDKMVNTISELAISQVSEMPSLITDINFVPDEEQEVKWTIEDKCRICAIIKESFTVTMTIMGERQQPFPADGPEKKRCFDYEELGTYGPPGRGAREACGLCPCEKK